MSIKTPCIVPGKQLAMEKHNTKTNKKKHLIFLKHLLATMPGIGNNFMN